VSSPQRLLVNAFVQVEQKDPNHELRRIRGIPMNSMSTRREADNLDRPDAASHRRSK
jgi:hypothetical protein